MNISSSGTLLAKSIKVVLLTGFGEGSQTILNSNKAFLAIEGIPIFVYVLKTILSLDKLDRIVIVGSPLKSRPIVDQYFSGHASFQKIFCVNQGKTIYESISNGVLFFSSTHNSQFHKEDGSGPFLFLPGDIPLLTKKEVEVFLARSFNNESDYCVGIVSEKKIQEFCRQRALNNFNAASYPFKEGTYRINNLHLLKFLRPGKGSMIDRVYQFRFLYRFVTLLPLTRELFKRRFFKLFYYFILMQGLLLLKKNGFQRLVNMSKVLLSLRQVEKCVGHILDLKISTVELVDVTAAMDIDNDGDYYAIQKLIARHS